MAVLEVKYKIGDTVYCARTHSVSKKHPCPDCGGSRKWKAISPAGQEYTFACPRCAARYLGDKNASLEYHEYEPLIEKLTIGSIRVDTNDAEPFSYMCVETGVGSGSIYKQSMLFPDNESALEAAKIEATKRNSETVWVSDHYKGSLDLSDYELSDARDKGAVEDAKAKYDKVRYFADDILEAVSMEEVKEIHSKHFGEAS